MVIEGRWGDLNQIVELLAHDFRAANSLVQCGLVQHNVQPGLVRSTQQLLSGDARGYSIIDLVLG
jgi:hypothetical protein